MQRVILKIGTAVLSADSDKVELSNGAMPSLELRIQNIVEAVLPYLSSESQQLIIVSSGAIGIGRHKLGLKARDQRNLAEKQVLASIGQTQLIECYSKALSRHSYSAGQILLTSEDLQNPIKKQNLVGCLRQMEQHKIVPIVNENDVLSTEEIRPLEGVNANWFGDNDRLSSLLAIEVSAAAQVILTTSKGIYKEKPKTDLEQPLAFVEDLEQLNSVATWQGTSQGRGGMQSKIEAVQFAARNGISTWVTSGSDIEGLSTFFKNFQEKTTPSSGTFVQAKGATWKKNFKK